MASFFFFAVLVIVSFWLELHPILQIKNWFLGLKSWIPELLQKLKKEKNLPLKQKLNKISGKEKQNMLQQNVHKASEILTETHQADKVGMMKKACIILFFVGAVIALLTQNILLLPVLALGFTLIPLWIVQYNEFRYKKKLAGELETALSVITTSYIRLRNLQRAIEENLDYLHSPVKEEFSRMVNQILYIDPSISNAISHLKKQFRNKVFQEWCDVLLLCQQDHTMIPSLLPIVKQFSVDRELQNSLETIILQPTRNYLTLAVTSLGIIPLIAILSKEWFSYLIHTWAGKAGISVLCVIIFFGLNKAIGLSTPIEERPTTGMGRKEAL